MTLETELRAKVVEALEATSVLSLQASGVLAALGLDDLPALAQRGAMGLADGPWSYEHEGVGHELVKRDEIAYAVLRAAFGQSQSGDSR